MQAVNYWGISDEGAWLGAPVGLVCADGTPKPSYDALHGLVRSEWWHGPTTLRTDAAGRVAVRGFLGDYRVSADDAAASFSLTTPGAVEAEVSLPR